MRTDHMPITPEVLTWARERSGYSIEDLKRKYPRFGTWESGAAGPTYAQLEDLAGRFRVPIAVIFFPEPPDVPPIEESFRTTKSEQFARLPPRIRLLLRKAKALQLSLDELFDGRSFSGRLITRDLVPGTFGSLVQFAPKARDYLAVSMETQSGWQRADDAFKAWRQALFHAGIYVFKDQFRQVGFSGFSLYHEEFPIIYVNNSTAATRQVFTLFHELAHLLMRTSGIESARGVLQPDDDYRRTEAAVNRFASRFLVPESAFKQALGSRPPNAETAADLANRFNVSREFVYRRFLDARMISSAEYESRTRTWSEQRGQGTGGNYYANQIAYLGRPYVRQAFSTYYKNKIDALQLADYLQVKPASVEPFEEAVLGRDLRP